ALVEASARRETPAGESTTTLGSEGFPARLHELAVARQGHPVTGDVAELELDVEGFAFGDRLEIGEHRGLDGERHRLRGIDRDPVRNLSLLGRRRRGPSGAAFTLTVEAVADDVVHPSGERHVRARLRPRPYDAEECRCLTISRGVVRRGFRGHRSQVHAPL